MDKNTFIASIAIFFLGCLIGLNGIYLPKMEELRLLRDMQKEEEARARLLDEMKALEKKVTTYQERLISSGKEEIELLNRVREIAAESKVRVTSMTPIEERDRRKRKYKKFSLNISFEGDYHLLGDFVSKVENSEKVMKIDMLEFMPKGTEEEFPLQCNLTLSIFSVP